MRLKYPDASRISSSREADRNNCFVTSSSSKIPNGPICISGYTKVSRGLFSVSAGEESFGVSNDAGNELGVEQLGPTLWRSNDRMLSFAFHLNREPSSESEMKKTRRN